MASICLKWPPLPTRPPEKEPGVVGENDRAAVGPLGQHLEGGRAPRAPLQAVADLVPPVAVRGPAVVDLVVYEGRVAVVQAG